ncbi:Uncharacterised protein [Chlamydia trachomatis]|nr:Uncharacterised protein [Chlamydia trachomatis]
MFTFSIKACISLISVMTRKIPRPHQHLALIMLYIHLHVLLPSGQVFDRTGERLLKGHLKNTAKTCNDMNCFFRFSS